MHIVFAASECAPYASTGALADAVAGLSRELVRQGHRITVYLPLYRQTAGQVPKRSVLIPSLTIPFLPYSRFVQVLDGGKKDGVEFYFLDCPELFDREALYSSAAGDYPDNAERFGLMCRSVLEASKVLGVPDLFHVHDWQASLLPVYLRTTYYFDPLLRRVPSVLTIHDVSYQGSFPPETTAHLLLPWETFTSERLEHSNALNFLKGGIVYSDAITTVSQSYAEEIQTPQFGQGLDLVLQRRAADLHGILNGVDYDGWDPAVDPRIAAHYSAANLALKWECRRDLLHAFGLDAVADSTAVVTMISPLATSKGFDLLAEVFDQLAQEDIVILISGWGEPYYEDLLRAAQQRNPGKLAAVFGLDSTLTHKMVAGADFLFMPSHTEPSGEFQFYALRYGTVPVVRSTGGLKDSVEDWEPKKGKGTGFQFAAATGEAILGGIRRALEVFHGAGAESQRAEAPKGNSPSPASSIWQKLMRNGMAKDFSWKAPAARYQKVYEEVVQRKL